MIIISEKSELDMLLNDITDFNRHSEIFNEDNIIGNKIW